MGDGGSQFVQHGVSPNLASTNSANLFQSLFPQNIWLFAKAGFPMSGPLAWLLAGLKKSNFVIPLLSSHGMHLARGATPDSITAQFNLKTMLTSQFKSTQVRHKI